MFCVLSAFSGAILGRRCDVGFGGPPKPTGQRPVFPWPIQSGVRAAALQTLPCKGWRLHAGGAEQASGSGLGPSPHLTQPLSAPRGIGAGGAPVHRMPAGRPELTGQRAVVPDHFAVGN